jgi:adenylate cyclase
VFSSLALAGFLAMQSKSPLDFEVGDRAVTAGSTQIPLDSDWRVPIWFNGGPGTYEAYSYSHIVYSQMQIDAGEEPGLAPELFKGKIVFVGVNATGLYDMFTTPYAGSAGESDTSEQGSQLGKMAGVEVHANVLDDLLHNRYLLDPPGWLNWTLGLSITLFVVVLVFYTRLVYAGPLSIVFLGGYLWLAQYVFGVYHYRLPVAAAGLCWSLALGAGLAYQYWVEGAEKRQVKGIFSRFVSRDVFQQLMDDPESARLGGQRMTVTVLFSDLRGFTTLSEKRSPEEIVTLLNEYFSAMVDIVFQHQGTVDKFVGDMIMALFNAPLSDPLHADHAVQCALGMQKRLAELNVEWSERGLPSLASGVGINSGEMIAGNVGAESIRSYTVIGDNVNLGSRLESLCKEYKARIIISEFTRNLLRESYDLEELGDVLVKGKTKPVKAFGVRIDGRL